MRFLARLALSALFVGCAGGAAMAQDGGAWTGVGLQVTPRGAQSEWTVSVRLDSAGEGRIEYPSLGCIGLLSAKGAPAGAYRETITAGPCISGGTVRLVPLGDKRGYLWTGEMTGAPDVNASAVLFASAKPTS